MNPSCFWEEATDKVSRVSLPCTSAFLTGVALSSFAWIGAADARGDEPFDLLALRAATERRAVVAPDEVYEFFDDDIIGALRREQARVIVIDENWGGDPDVAMRLARWVHFEGVTVKVLRACMSACSYIALASRDLRMAPDAMIGLHSWAAIYPLTERLRDLGPSETEAIWAELREFLGEILQEEAAAEVYRLIRATPHEDVALLDTDDLRKIGISVTIEE